MSNVHSIKSLLAGQVAEGTEVVVQGWVRTRRDSKAGLSFVNVSDGSCFAPMQVVAESTLPNYEDGVKKLTSGASVRVTGKLVANQGKGDGFEVLASDVEVMGLVDDPETYPIQPKAHSMEYLREVAHLRPRTNLFGAVTRIRHRLAMAVHEFFDQNGFYWINTPIVTASDAEGAGQMFRLSTLDLANLPRTDKGEVDFKQDFFGREAFLTVSGQLNVEAYCLAMSKVYTFGPTFRAENSHTARHLAEFWMIEPEIAFANLNDNADLAEAFLKHLFQSVLDHCADDLAFLEKRVDDQAIVRLENFIKSPFARVEYGEAIKLLQASNKKFEFPVEWGMDLQTEHERWLAEEHIGRPVVVMNYPEHIKAFYMRMNDDGKTVAAMDVLAPGIGEIIGGAQREDRLDVLDERMKQFGLDPAHYQWYRDLRRYGSVPHAGFGLGFERLIVYVCGLANIRDAIPYPRVAGSAEF